MASDGLFTEDFLSIRTAEFGFVDSKMRDRRARFNSHTVMEGTSALQTMDRMNYEWKISRGGGRCYGGYRRSYP